MLWKTFDMPDNGGRPGGYSGGAIWQPPAIDPKRGTLFIGTGNNYTAPADVEACQNATPTANCVAADDFFDTAFALDLKNRTDQVGDEAGKVLTLGRRHASARREQTRTVPCQQAPISIWRIRT